jgi:hypothetical protein
MLNSPLGGRRMIEFGLGRGWQRGGFLPTDIAGLQLWLDFSDASTLFVDAGITPVSADGQAIYQANDKSGNGKNLTQATAGKRPLYKTGIKNFLSCGQFIRANNTELNNTIFSQSQPMTIFAVGKYNNIEGYQALFDSYNNVQSILYIRYISGTSDYYNVAFGEVFPLYPSNNNFNFNLHTVIVNGASSLYQINDGTEQLKNIGANGFSGITVGDVRPAYNDYNMDGYYSELILYSGLLSAENITSIKIYLNNKWAIY